jgi:hypothetical protein
LSHGNRLYKIKLKRRKKSIKLKNNNNKIEEGERGGASCKNNEALYQKERRIGKVYYK